MSFATAIQLSARSIRRAPVKAALTGLGLCAGVLAITLTVASGEGARRAVLKQWRAMVGNMDALFVTPGGPAQRGMATMETAIATLTPEDGQAIAASVPNVKQVCLEQSSLSAPIEASGKNGTTALFGVSPNWVAIRGDAMGRGAMFTDASNQGVERVAAIGTDVAREFFPGADPVGRPVTIRGVQFTVIGVLNENGAGPGGVSLDNLVLVPILTATRRVFNRSFVNQIRVQLIDPGRSGATAQAVAALLRERHRLAPGQLDDFRVATPQALMARVRNVDTALARIIFWVGVLGLALGGVLVANLMYAAAVERTAEIGMRRAAGATRADILRQFWTEAVVISTAAGSLGVVLSLITVALAGRLSRAPLAVSWPATAAALAATSAVGIVAGFWPARRAAALAPADALRRQA